MVFQMFLRHHWWCTISGQALSISMFVTSMKGHLIFRPSLRSPKYWVTSRLLKCSFMRASGNHVKKWDCSACMARSLGLPYKCGTGDTHAFLGQLQSSSSQWLRKEDFLSGPCSVKQTEPSLAHESCILLLIFPYWQHHGRKLIGNRVQSGSQE